jgi:hypothetical protein
LGKDNSARLRVTRLMVGVYSSVVALEPFVATAQPPAFAE